MNIADRFRKKICTYYRIMLQFYYIISWLNDLLLWIMAPRHTHDITWDPATSYRSTAIFIAMRTIYSIRIICRRTCFDITLTKPSITRMSIVRRWATIRTFFITRAIDRTFVMLYPTISHALRIMITSSDTFINESITYMFAF